MSELGFKNKKVFVYGLGKSGLSLAASLYVDGAEVYVYDKRGLDKIMSNIAGKKLLDKNNVFFADDGEVDFSTFDSFFKSPGIDINDPLVKKAKNSNLEIMGDVDLLYKREKDAMFIGITGTNGKSTTTALIGHVLEKAGLKVATGGNLGTACLNLAKNQDIYVLELSSYQLETMNVAQMDRSIILNLSPDHLNRHGDMQGYLNEKIKIFNKNSDKNILGIDSDYLFDIKDKFNSLTVSVDGKNANIMVNEKGVLMHDNNEVIDLSDYNHLPGKHNWQNIACAYGAVFDLVHLETFKEALHSFKNLAHRMEKIAEYKGITFYNDSKATNPDSAIRALESIENIFWICGGELKDEGITPCLDHLNNVKAAFVIGDSSSDVTAELGQKVESFDCKTIDNAIYKLWEQYEISGLDKSTVLLSPACASWDQFDNFEHRGDVFVSLCHELITRLKEGELSE